jgi:hypothetical protein
VTGPVNPELFRRTAPKWNCVDYPNDGPHYTPKDGCEWCGKKREQIAAEYEALAREGIATAADIENRDHELEA